MTAIINYIYEVGEAGRNSPNKTSLLIFKLQLYQNMAIKKAQELKKMFLCF
jgi:hypothetical protein